MAEHATSLLERCLDDLEERIDDAVENALLAEWTAFVDGAFAGGVFRPARLAASPPRADWPDLSVNQALDDPDLMLLRQYKTCSDMLASGNGALMCVRADYGTAIVPTLFGAELFRMDDAMNTLPTTRPLGAAATRVLPERGIPRLDEGLGAWVFEIGDRFRDIAARYPKIGRHVHPYHPDAQGPLDLCELLWGSSLFEAVCVEPDAVAAVLDLLTDTHIAFLRCWFSLFSPTGKHAVHWGMLHPGTVMLRDDSAMNLSPEHYDRFAKAYDARCLEALGGGAIHFCGRGDHYIETMSGIAGLSAIALSQPDWNDMETIYRNTVDKGILLLGLSRETAESALAAGRPLHGRVHAA